MKGNFWMVEMMIGVPPASAWTSCCVFSSIFSTTPCLVLELIDGVLQLLLGHVEVHESLENIEQAVGAPHLIP